MDITTLDLVQRFAFDAAHGCAVLGNAATGEYLLIPLRREPLLSEGEILRVRLGNFQFAGVFGVLRGYVDHRLENARRDVWEIMRRAAPAYRAYVAALPDEPVTVDDSAAWLEKLHALEDPRD